MTSLRKSFMVYRIPLWIGVSMRKRFISSSYQVLGQNLSTLYLRSKRSIMIKKAFEPLIRSTFCQFKDLVEREFFYGATLSRWRGLFHYYEPAYWKHKEISNRSWRTRLVGKMILIHPRLCWPSSPIFDGCLSFIEYLQGDDWPGCGQESKKLLPFGEMISFFIQEELSRFLIPIIGWTKCSEVLSAVITKMSPRTSVRLFINPVYLANWLGRETNATFAELLNKQWIKAAQQLLLSTNDSIEDI